MVRTNMCNARRKRKKEKKFQTSRNIGACYCVTTRGFLDRCWSDANFKVKPVTTKYKQIMITVSELKESVKLFVLLCVFNFFFNDFLRKLEKTRQQTVKAS